MPNRRQHRSNPASIRPTTGFAALTFAAFLTGCSVLPQRTAPHGITTYRITPPAATVVRAAGHAPVCPALRVSAVSAAAGFTGVAMRYSETPGTIASYAFNRWAAPPARMLDTILVDSLSDSGLFASILSPDSPADAQLQLDTQLDVLLQRVDGTQSNILFVARASLVDLTARRQLASRLFELDVPARAANPQAGAQATDLAVGQWTRTLTAWLGTLAHQGLCNAPK